MSNQNTIDPSTLTSSMDERLDTIAFQDINFLYPNSSNGIQGVSFEIPAGTKVGIIGESGSGKSTLLKLLARFVEPQSGDILINGKAITSFSLDEWLQKLVYLSQDSYVFKESILHNILLSDAPLAPDQYRPLYELLQTAGLLPSETYSEAALTTFLNRDAHELSAGQKQRLLVVRCLFKNAEVTIFDEPTNALDNVNAKNIMNAIMTHCSDKIVVLASHKLHLLSQMDLIILVDNGRMVKVGTPQSLLTKQYNDNIYD